MYTCTLSCVPKYQVSFQVPSFPTAPTSQRLELHEISEITVKKIHKNNSSYFEKLGKSRENHSHIRSKCYESKKNCQTAKTNSNERRVNLRYKAIQSTLCGSSIECRHCADFVSYKIRLWSRPWRKITPKIAVWSRFRDFLQPLPAPTP